MQPRADVLNRKDDVVGAQHCLLVFRRGLCNRHRHVRCFAGADALAGKSSIVKEGKNPQPSSRPGVYLGIIFRDQEHRVCVHNIGRTQKTLSIKLAAYDFWCRTNNVSSQRDWDGSDRDSPVIFLKLETRNWKLGSNCHRIHVQRVKVMQSALLFHAIASTIIRVRL